MEGPPAEPDRHARPRRLHVRGVALARRPARARCSSSTLRRGSRRRRSRTPTSRSRTTSRSSRREQDRPAAGATRTVIAAEVADLVGDTPDHVLRLSAKTGEGVEAALDAIVERIPPPDGRPRRAAARADLRLGVRPVPRASSRSCASSTGRLDAASPARDGGGDALRRRGARFLRARR